MGVFLATFSGLSYAIYIILMSIKEVKDIDNIVVTMYVTFGAATGIFIYSILNGSLVTKISMNLTVSYIYIAVISTILSMVLLLKGIELIGASSASILGTFEPIVSIIMGIIIFKEQLTFSLIMGTIFILISTIILAKDKSGNETIEEVIEKKNKDVGFEI